MSLKKKKSKRYISITENLDRSKTYKVEEAIKLIKEKSKVKFVESFDMCLNLNIDNETHLTFNCFIVCLRKL